MVAREQTEDTVIVAGGAGYVGSHACKALAAAGYRPITVDSLTTGHEWAVQWGPLEPADVRDAAALDAIFARHRPVAVLHFCAFSLVAESVRDPLSSYDNNILGTLRLLQAAQRHEVRAFVFSSTAAVYGIPDTHPIAEAAPSAPINPYGATKAACERMLADQAAAGGVPYAALRYFNAAGADPEAETGELHQPETHLIPLAIRACLDPEFTLTVFGRDYDTPDGTAVRDYVHVTDLADAHVRALQHLLGGGESLVANLGCGTGYTVQQVVDSVGRVSQRPVKVRDGDRRPGDPPALVADGTRARQILDWTPRRTALDDIVGTALRWHERVPFWRSGNRRTPAPAASR